MTALLPPEAAVAVHPPSVAATTAAAVLPATSLVRAAHVLSAAVLVGGAALLWAVLRDAGADGSTARLARSYEWAFWGAAGVLVATGVGNVGAIAPGVPAAGTRWGATFAAKLLLLVALLVGSIGRTVAVAAVTGPGSRWLRRAYGLTALSGGLLVVLAVVLAHG